MNWQNAAAQIQTFRGTQTNVLRDAGIITSDIVEAVLRSGNLAALAEQAHDLPRARLELLSRAFMGRALLYRLDKMDEGTDITPPQQREWQAEVRVQKSGVKIYEAPRAIKFSPGVVRNSKPLCEDKIIKGAIGFLSTAPKLGGVISLRRKLFVSHIQGLVNPATGEPRVSLEIFGRYI